MGARCLAQWTPAPPGPITPQRHNPPATSRASTDTHGGNFSASEDVITSLPCAWRHAHHISYPRFARFVAKIERQR